MKEAAARVKINKLLEAAGWRFFADEKGAADIKLFLRTENARRVLFLVDRDDWRHAEIVVSTVQSFFFNNKYRGLLAHGF